MVSASKMLLFFALIFFHLKSFSSENEIHQKNEMKKEIKELGSFFNAQESQRVELLKKAEYLVIQANKLSDAELEFEARSVVTYSLSVLGRDEDVMNSFNNYYESNKNKYPKSNLAKIRFLSAMTKVTGYQENYVRTKELISEIELIKEQERNSPYILSFTYLSLGEAYYLIGEYKSSFQNLNSAKKLIPELKESTINVSAYEIAVDSLTANLLFELEDYKNALVIYNSNYKRAKIAGDYEKIGLNQYNIALVYTLLENWVEVRRFAKLSLSSSKLVELHIYHGLSLELLALSERKLGDYGQALSNQNNAIELFRKLNNFEAELFGTIQLALIHLAKGDYNAAESTMVRIDSMSYHSTYDIKKDDDYLSLKYQMAKHNKDYATALESSELLAKSHEQAAINSIQLIKTTQDIHALKLLDGVGDWAKGKVQANEVKCLLPPLFKEIFFSLFILAIFSVIIMRKSKSKSDDYCDLFEDKAGEALYRATKSKPVAVCRLKILNAQAICDDVDFMKGKDVEVLLRDALEMTISTSIREWDLVNMQTSYYASVILVDVTEDDVYKIFDRINSKCSELKLIDREVCSVKMSVGVSFYYGDKLRKKRDMNSVFFHLSRTSNEKIQKNKINNVNF